MTDRIIKEQNEIRTPLEPGVIILVESNYGGARQAQPIRIGSVLGYGGSCIVYEGFRQEENFERRVIVKEFYPASFREVVREGMMLDFSSVARKDYDGYLDRFKNGAEKFKQYYEFISRDELSANQIQNRPFIEGEANGTYYAISDPNDGIILSELDQEKGGLRREDLSLQDAVVITRSLAKAIEVFHKNDSLYLDTKPDNICLEKDENGVFHAKLFDFDTVEKKLNVKRGKALRSISLGWAPKEQEQWERHKIDERADLYSIGAVFFWILTGRKPNRSDIDAVRKETFHIQSQFVISLGDIDVCSQSINELYRDIDSIIYRTVNDDIDERYTGVDQLIRALNELNEKIKDRPAVERINDLTKTVKEEGGKTTKSINRLIYVAIALAAVMIIAVGLFFALGKKAIDTVSPNSNLEVEQQMDEHIIMKLSNANHQYEVGLENWRRLDYNRAERDITSAINDVTEEKSQAEIEVAKINNSLGCLYLDMGRYEDSYDYLNHAYVTFRDEYGEDAAETLAVLFSIAQYDYYSGDYDTALKQAQLILDNTDIASNKTISTLIKHFQASIFESRGDYKGAQELYQEVLSIYQDYLEDDKLINELASYTEDAALDESEREEYTNMVLWIAKTYEQIGKTDAELGKTKEALDAVDHGLDMCLDNIYIGKKNIGTARLYLQKASIEAAMGNVDDAVDDADRAIRIEKNLFDFQEVYPGLVEAYDLYGSLMEQEENEEEAASYYDSALELALQSYGENHPNTAEAYYYCGQFAYHEEQYTDAEESLSKAIDIRKNILGENHPDTVKYYLLLSEVEAALGKTDEAKECENKANRIEESIAE